MDEFAVKCAGRQCRHAEAQRPGMTAPIILGAPAESTKLGIRRIYLMLTIPRGVCFVDEHTEAQGD